MAQVQRCGWPDPNHQLQYLTEKEMDRALGSATLGQVTGFTPALGDDDAARIRRVLTEIFASTRCAPVLGWQMCDVSVKCTRRTGTLVVSHGDVLGQWIEMTTGKTVFSVECCAWTMYVLLPVPSIPSHMACNWRV